jgi:hypothetical protein
LGRLLLGGSLGFGLGLLLLPGLRGLRDDEVEERGLLADDVSADDLALLLSPVLGAVAYASAEDYPGLGASMNVGVPPVNLSLYPCIPASEPSMV